MPLSVVKAMIVLSLTPISSRGGGYDCQGAAARGACRASSYSYVTGNQLDAMSEDAPDLAKIYIQGVLDAEAALAGYGAIKASSCVTPVLRGRRFAERRLLLLPGPSQ